MLDEIELDDTWLNANEAPTKGDNALFVRFRMHPKKDEVATKAEGRPIFKSVEYISIGSPGDKWNHVDRPATAKDRVRFRRHYRAFKENVEDQQSGTPLSKWPLMDAAQVEELKYFNVRTVEQLALMPDGNIPQVGNISHLKKHAVDFLAMAKGTAPATQLRAELEKRDAMLEAMQRQLSEQSAALAKMQAKAQAAVPAEPQGDLAVVASVAKRGRPKKVPTQQAEE
jgi:hypothetical protein